MVPVCQCKQRSFSSCQAIRGVCHELGVALYNLTHESEKQIGFVANLISEWQEGLSLTGCKALFRRPEGAGWEGKRKGAAPDMSGAAP